jgi:hypothetical protein
MKTGRSLQDLAAELELQRDSRKDYIAAQGAIEAVVDDRLGSSGFNGDSYGITPHAHRQLADHLAIPKAYYDRMLVERPGLLTQNINTWLRAEPDNRRMVRVLNGRMRAFMSSKYRPLDNFELAEHVIPKLIELGVLVTSCELTETRMYIKGILPDLSDILPEGVVWGSGHTKVAEYGGNERGRVVASIVVSNSDVGAGTLRIEPGVFTTWCTNLAILFQLAMKKYHVGRAFEASEDQTIYRDETREADDKAFWLKVQDVTAAAFDRKVFEAAVAEIREASEVRLESADLPAVVDVTVRQLKLPEKTSTSILKYLAVGGDLSKWGLSSAVTAAANVVEDYELATELERAGGKVLALPDPAWRQISTAKAA